MCWRDAKNSYGWVSILLHWVSGFIIVVLWYTGDSAQGASYAESQSIRVLHVSIAFTAYLLIFARVIWRTLKGHPHISGQNRFSHLSAKFTHYLIFLTLVVMLVSGPLVVCSAGQEFYLFGIKIFLAPITAIQSWGVAARYIHGVCAHLLGILILLHVGAAFKHMMFNDDDTFIRIFLPSKTKNKPFIP